MEEKKIEIIKTWPKPQSVIDIQVFLGFANFYRRFIKNYNRIVVPFTLILQITDNNNLTIQANKNKKNQDTLRGNGSIGGGDKVDRSIKNLSIVAKSTKSKKSDLPKANFVKVYFFETDFLTLESKKTFIHLQKTFTKTLILRQFDLEPYLQIETNTLKYTIS